MNPTFHTLDGPHGPLRIRVHQPDGAARAGLVWSHGGGFLHGDLEMPESVQVARELAARGITTVEVDYRLAPSDERPDGVHFPVPQDEVRHVLATVRADTSLDTGGRDWSIGGASAGASITASAALRLVADGQAPRQVLLAYPTVHAELPAPSDELAAVMVGVEAARRFTPESVRSMNANHAAGATDGVFAGGAELAGFPPTCIVDSERDDLRASGAAFADELRAAGVPVTYAVEPGTFHGHLNDEGSAEALRTIERFAAFLLAD
ncbi:alpha/beta hydrolase [Curtobacterium sp. 'Ferrero']|uniref:alpha/beta hydrolase n=1 Tax=Curtobacterium sp. 'Ferrero' TaxID=2033654 RepID=UPI000BD720A7|nr:alpha/beta hydrolase fold domain-containing protein [Curtobacterium sp. 'Ferrero']PCN48335.1 alpha/beta hydrolase [Curtobacterium sp. 'Ferrero']